MQTRILMITGLAGLAMLGSCAIAKAASPGDRMFVPFVCEHQMTIEHQIDALYKEKSIQVANDMLHEAEKTGECGAVGVDGVEIKEVGKVRGAVVINGVPMIFQAVKVQAPTGKFFWTANVEPAT